MKTQFVITPVFFKKLSILLDEVRRSLAEHGTSRSFLPFLRMPEVFFKIFEEYLKKNNLTEENFIFESTNEKKEFLKIMKEKKICNQKFFQRMSSLSLSHNSLKLLINLNFLFIVIEETLGEIKVKKLRNTLITLNADGNEKEGEIDFKISGENISIHIDSEDFILTLIIPKDKVPFSTETKNGAHLLFYTKNLKKQE